jgi:GTPase Era involved in 16S rRNA processing
LQELNVATQRLKQMVLGQNHDRCARIEQRVGAELAHMMRKHVKVTLRVKVRKNAVIPLEEQ